MLETTSRESNDFLTGSDIDILRKIEHIRMNFGRFIDKKEIIDSIKDIIDNSKFFAFKNERVKKYISLNAPSFIIAADYKSINDELSKDILATASRNQNTAVTEISRLISSEITSKASDIIIEKMKDSDEIAKIFGSKDIALEDETLEIFESASFFIASIFGITCNFKENTIVIEMVI